MKPQIIPISIRDRVSLSMSFISLIFLIKSIYNTDYNWSVYFLLATIILLIITYVFQDVPKNSIEFNDYKKASIGIKTINTELNNLSTFLAQEQNRVIETEEILRKLHNERTQLEPVIEAKREEVEAILKLYTHSITKNVWKERVSSFILGVLASLIASYIFQYFTY